MVITTWIGLSAGIGFVLGCWWHSRIQRKRLQEMMNRADAAAKRIDALAKHYEL